MMLNLALLIVAFAHHCCGASQIALFSDTNCQDSLRGVEGPNGYPNGTCTDLRRSGPYGSFQVVGLDDGCTVTIYVNDTSRDICSGYQEEIQPVDCYNSTFAYYSFDFCTPGGAKFSATPLPSVAAASSSGPPIGTIVGGVIGGVFGLCIIVGIVVYMMRKKKQRKQHNIAGVYESDGAEVKPYYMQEPQELGEGMILYKRNAVEVEQPPVELAGSEMGHDDRKAMR